MILVLCNSFQEAMEDFKLFKEYLRYTAMTDVREVYSHALCIVTDDDLRYIFIDRRYYPKLKRFHCDTIDEMKFMEEVYEFFDRRI